MLALVFRVGPDRYAVPCRDVEEVVPMVGLRPVPHAPPWVAGLARWRGTVIPVIDACRMLLGRDAAPSLGTRIVVVRHLGRPLGLLAESVADTLPLDPGGGPGLAMPTTPYLGEIRTAGGDTVQLVTVERLLPPDVAAVLHAAADT